MDGKGTIKSQRRLGLLQYWTAVFTWKLDASGNLISIKDDIYYPIDMENTDEKPVVLKEELQVYMEKDLSSKTMLLEPSEEEVTFPMTDNENWVFISRADGSEGWFYLKDALNIISDGKEIPCTNIFENLFFAD